MALPRSDPRHLEPTLEDLEAAALPAPGARAKAAYDVWRLQAAGTPANVRANDPTGDQGAPPSTAADTQSECGVAAFGSNVVVAWNDSKGLRLGSPTTVSSYGYSTNGGATFADGGNVPLLNAGEQAYGDCTLDVDASGNFYLAAIYVGGTQDVAVYRGTFLGANFSWNAPVIAASGAAGLLDKPYLTVDKTDGSIYVSYTRFGGTAAIEVVRGTALGTAWSAPVVLDNTTSGIQGSRPIVGPEGNLYVCYQADWGWLNCDLSSTNGRVVLRRSRPASAMSFDPEVTVGTVQANWMSYWGGNLRNNALFFPDVAVDRSGGPHNGNLYVIWNEAVPWTANAASGVSTAEAEPNNVPGDSGVKTITPGGNATGTISASSDFDFWKLGVTAGQRLILRLEPQGWSCPSTGTIRNFQIRLFKGVTGTSGDSILANSNINQFVSDIVFDAPETATYIFRVRNVNSSGTLTGTYTVKTRTLVYGSPSPGRDMRDIVVARSSDQGATFAPEVVVNDDAAGLDNEIPAIACDASGNVHAFWYDARNAAGARILRSYYRAVSADGGATWLPNQRLSNELQYFNLNTVAVPNYGEYNQACAAGDRVYATWSDERLSHAAYGQSGPDAYVAALQSCVTVICAPDTLVGAGGSFTRRLCMGNCGSFGDDFSYTITDSLGWCGGSSAMVHIAAGGSACVTVPCSVPPGTPPGTVNALTISARPTASPDEVAACRSRITVSGTANVAVLCPPDTLVTPGMTVVVGFRVYNTGGGNGTFDYFVDDGAGWSSTPSGSVFLPAGGDALVPVSVNVPANAYGAVEPVRFEATVQGSLPLRADSCTTTVSTRRVSGLEYLPAKPRAVALLPNEPNPFNPSTRLVFEIPVSAPVDLDVYTVGGRHVRSLLRQADLAAGRYAKTWDGADDAGNSLASGIYVLRLRVGDVLRSRQALLLK